MERDEIKKQIYEAIVNVKNMEPDRNKESLTLVHDLSFDSIDLVDLLFEVEKLTGVSITVGDLISYLKSVPGERIQHLTIAHIINYVCEH